MLDYQAKSESLFGRSGDVVPLKLRKDPIEKPLKATALVSYYQKEVRKLFVYCVMKAAWLTATRPRLCL